MANPDLTVARTHLSEVVRSQRSVKRANLPPTVQGLQEQASECWLFWGKTLILREIRFVGLDLLQKRRTAHMRRSWGDRIRIR